MLDPATVAFLGGSAAAPVRNQGRPMTMTPAAERLLERTSQGSAEDPDASGEEERMHNQGDQGKTQRPQSGDPAPLEAAGRDDRAAQGERKPSKIERRDWRGSGVCGDRHTD
jgi:hypothetical protein